MINEINVYMIISPYWSNFFSVNCWLPRDPSTNSLKEDPVFQLFLNKKKIASQASLSRFWDRTSQETIVQFQPLNQLLSDKARLERNLTELIIDLDSTDLDTFEHQEETNYNVYYETNGYHPLWL